MDSGPVGLGSRQSSCRPSQRSQMIRRSGPPMTQTPSFCQMLVFPTRPEGSPAGLKKTRICCHSGFQLFEPSNKNQSGKEIKPWQKTKLKQDWLTLISRLEIDTKSPKILSLMKCWDFLAMMSWSDNGMEIDPVTEFHMWLELDVAFQFRKGSSCVFYMCTSYYSLHIVNQSQHFMVIKCSRTRHHFEQEAHKNVHNSQYGAPGSITL